MSVQTEITRLNTAKSDIATAITNKGVTVPSSTKLDGMAALIEGVKTGVIEVSTSAGMDAVLTEANVGKAYKFTGTTDDTYTNGDVYVVEEKDGVTITIEKEQYNDWDGQYTYVVYNGTTYRSPTSFEAEVGDAIEVVAGENTRYGGTIRVNSNVVAFDTYTYTVVSNATFEMVGVSTEGWVDITEEG